MVRGSVCDEAPRYSIPANVVLAGQVDDKLKRTIYFASDIAINPMNSDPGRI